MKIGMQKKTHLFSSFRINRQQSSRSNICPSDFGRTVALAMQMYVCLIVRYVFFFGSVHCV